MSRFEFVRISKEDLPILHEWLNRPHVAKNWDGPITIAEVELKYGPRVESDTVFSYKVLIGNRAIGFIQKYEAKQGAGGWWPDEPSGTWGVDLFLSEEYLLGQGLGSELLKTFTDQMLEDSRVVQIVIDPSPQNERAIRSYEKAGFTKCGEVLTPEGPALLMKKARSF